LHRWTRGRAVRAKHATVTRARLKPRATGLAVIEKLAGIGGHGLDRQMAATRAGDGRLQDHPVSPIGRLSEIRILTNSN
jgi:hypothetical protein